MQEESMKQLLFRKKFISLWLIVMQLMVACGRNTPSRLRDSGSQRDATFGISIDTGGNVHIGAETRGYTEVVGLGERGSRGVDWSPVSSVRDGAAEVIRWVQSVFDGDVPGASASSSLEQGSPLTLDGAYIGGVLPLDLRSATRSGKREVVEEKYTSLAAARVAVDRQYGRSQEISSFERDHALRAAQTINQRLTVAAQRHNQHVSEVTTDLASLVEALKSLPQDAFKTDPATPSGAKLRRLSTYMAERGDELRANSGLPEATKGDLVAIAQTAASLADESYLEGDTATGDQLVEIAYEAFEVAIGFSPAGIGVDIYKVALGRDLMGRELASADRVLAITGVASLGLGGMLKSVGKGVTLTKRLVKALRASGRGGEALDDLANVERVAVAAEKLGLKGAGELKAIAEDLGASVPIAGKLVNVLDSAKKFEVSGERLGKLMGDMREWIKTRGNFGMGAGKRNEAEFLGESWVGPNAIKKDYPGNPGKYIHVSQDGTKQYREPVWKPRDRKTQANYEWREGNSGPFVGDGHFEVTD
jgi:hypothetical protein